MKIVKRWHSICLHFDVLLRWFFSGLNYFQWKNEFKRKIYAFCYELLCSIATVFFSNVLWILLRKQKKTKKVSSDQQFLKFFVLFANESISSHKQCIRSKNCTLSTTICYSLLVRKSICSKKKNCYIFFGSFDFSYPIKFPSVSINSRHQTLQPITLIH